ncbi:hypothetical protein Tco_0776295 [Tanacetum coccineum]
MPSFLSPEPTLSYFDDLDHFKYFENEFPAIVYNDALTSKLDFLTEPTVNPQHIDEFNLKDETSLSECNEEQQNVLYFNNLFPLNVIYLDDLKSDKDNDDDEIQSSVDMTPLPPRDQRHPWLRSVNRVHVLDFVGLTNGMMQTLAGRLRMAYTGDEGQELFTSHTWRRLFEIRGPLVARVGGARRRITWRQFIMALGLHTAEEMAEDGFQKYWDFLGSVPSYVYIRDPVRRICHRMIFCNISGKGQAPEKVTGMLREGRVELGLSGGYFIGRLAAYFGLVSDEGLRGLSVITREILMIDLHELVRLHICKRLNDTWAWVAS